MADPSRSYEIRCPVHGFIPFSDWEREVINHRAFQRLRRIRQLAWTDYVYPGAMHTRFEHSLGGGCTPPRDRLRRREHYREVYHTPESPAEGDLTSLRLIRQVRGDPVMIVRLDSKPEDADEARRRIAGLLKDNE